MSIIEQVIITLVLLFALVAIVFATFRVVNIWYYGEMRNLAKLEREFDKVKPKTGTSKKGRHKVGPYKQKVS